MVSPQMIFVLLGLVCIFIIEIECCSSLPPMQIINGRRFRLHPSTECKGGKVHEIQHVQDYDQCRDACARFDCKGVNVFQVGEYEFVCEILAYVDGVVRAEGAACYLGQ